MRPFAPHIPALIARATLLTILALVVSCSSLPTAPSKFARYRGLEMSLTLSSDSGDPAHPITAHVQVVNNGRLPVMFIEGCALPGLYPAVHAPDGANIQQACGECPGAPCPLCLSAPVILHSGESVGRTAVFDGTLLSCSGTYQGQPGVYKIDAILHAQTLEGRDMTVSRATSFAWSTRAPR